MTNVIADYPGYKILAPEIGKSGLPILRPDQVIAVRRETRHGEYWQSFVISDVMHEAEKMGESPNAAIHRADIHGHDIFFIFARGTSLSSHPQKEVYTGVEIGQTITYRGHQFRITAERNQNLGLTQDGDLS